MKIISIANQKGGVAKTTTTINLASYLAKKERRVLMIDTDSQMNLTKNVLKEEASTSLVDLLQGKPFEIMRIKDNLSLLPGSVNIIRVGQEINSGYINNGFNREFLLKKQLEKIKDDYDYILIDTSPNIDIITVNCLVASTDIIIPILTDQFSLDGIDQMIEYAAEIKENINPDLDILGILLTMYQKELRISKDIIKDLENSALKSFVFESKIRNNTAIKKAQAAKQDIFEFDRDCNAAIDYAAFGEEILLKEEEEVIKE